MRQLELLEKEIQESTGELNRIMYLHGDQVKKEEDLTREYVVLIRIYAQEFCDK